MKTLRPLYKKVKKKDDKGNDDKKLKLSSFFFVPLTLKIDL